VQPLIEDRVMKHFNRLNIVHYIPGRLRIHIPLLKRLPPEWLSYRPLLTKLIRLEKGLIDVELSIETGRALVHYDPRCIDDKKVLEWLRKLAFMLYGDLLETPPASRSQIGAFLKNVHTRYHRMLNRNCNSQKVY
jgi:hypothetical protein